MNSARLAAIMGFGLLLAATGQASAQEPAAQYPSRSVSFIVPFAPGGVTTVFARLVGQKLEEKLGKPFVVENRPGGGGVTAATAVARSAPDGYTIVLTDPGVVTNPTLQKDPPYDLKQVQAISIVGSSPAVIVASEHLPVKTFAEFIAYAKANPGKLNFASAGIGTAPHLAGEMIKLQAGIQMQHVPYRGIGSAYPDVLSGKVQLAFSSIAGAVPFTKDGRVRALATTGAKRSSVYPDVPTVAESGLPGFDVDLWIGIYGPTGMPPAVLAKLSSELNKVLQHPDLKAAFAKIGIEPRGTTPEEGAAFTRAEFEKWKKVITEGKIAPG
jgi:tripartite-type tricarboxylate transporter receptor subunit TctC